MKKPVYLLDTNIVSEITKPFPNANVVKKINELKSLCAISSTTWHELLYGIQIMPSGKNKDFQLSYLIEETQSAFPILPFDNHSAWIQADLRSRLKEKGLNKLFQDTQIASIAIANQMILVTRNVEDFEPMQKVSGVLYIENWFNS